MSSFCVYRNGVSYCFRLCEESDVENHSKIMADEIPEEDLESQKATMFECIKNKTAFVSEENDCFLYYLNGENKAFATAVAIYGRGKPLKTMAMFHAIFDQVDMKTHFITMVLHHNKTVKDFRTLFTTSSITNRVKKEDPLMINTSFLKRKMQKLFNRSKAK